MSHTFLQGHQTQASLAASIAKAHPHQHNHKLSLSASARELRHIACFETYSDGTNMRVFLVA